MRIAMIGSRGIPARHGGFETAIEEIGRRLVERGHQVVVYCRRHNSSTSSRWHLGMERVVLSSAHTKNLDTASHTLLSIMHALAFRRADILHFYGVGNALFLPLLRPMSSATVVTVDGPDWERPKWGRLARWSLRFSARLAVALADALIIDNRPSQRYFAEHFGTEGHYIPYGAYLADEPATEALESLGLHDRGYILFVGRLVPDKGVHLLVEAFEGVRTDLQLVIVGDDPYVPDYIHQLKSTRDPRIRFLGYQYGAPYRQLCSHAYLYVHPLLVDGTSPALLQAMGFGNCILTSDLPEAMDVAGDTGFSFRANDVGHLRRALQELVDRPEMVEDGRQRARERVGRLYNWDRVTNQHEELYRSLLATRRSRAPRQEREATS